MRQFGKYVWIGYTAARSNLAYAGEAVSRLLFMMVILYVFMRLWVAVYAGAEADRLAGLTLPQMLWYLVITESMLLSAPRVWAEVDQDVRTGRLSVQLIHPLSYMFGYLGRTLGERVVRFTMNLIAGSVVAMLLVGPITVTATGFLLFVLVLPVAFVLDFLGNFLVGLCAFWLESTAGIALIYSRMVMMFGATFLPLEIYPDVMQPVLRALPFASMVYAPGRMFVDPSLGLFAEFMVRQIGALISFLIAAGVLQTIALRRLFSNGG